MNRLNNLLRFIESNPDPSTERHWIWDSSDWEEELTGKIPNWKDIIKDKNNWGEIKNVKARRYNDSLWKLFIDVVGIDLLNYCLNSIDNDLQEVAKKWLEEKFVWKLDYIYPDFIDLWKKLNEHGKKYVINEVFERYPGEPFRSYRELGRDICMILPPIGYIPSREILNLREIIEKAGDKDSLKIVDEKIEERKKACEISISVNRSLQIPYILNRDEKELIARAIDKFRRNGYLTAPLPEIYLSYETPPLFVAYPELEEEIERKPQEEPVIPRNRQRGGPETISIEEVLGCYIPNQKIILYVRGISWCARKYGIEENLLRMVVLVHEIGHWITHLLPHRIFKLWTTEFFKASSEEVTEGWAQLITYWVVDEIGGEIKDSFEKLNRHQSSAYRVYEIFKGENVNKVISSLGILRVFNKPATLFDWKELMKIR